MMQGQRVLAIIPARGGSKGVKRKNLRDLGGRPLIAWSIVAAQQSEYVDRIVVSTEDEEIAQVARALGAEVPFSRPADLATDEASGMGVVKHALEQLPGYEWVVVLQPTSPLRCAGDIDSALRLCLEQSAPACMSVTEANPGPSWMFTLDGGGRLRKWLDLDVPDRRQDAPKVLALNGAVYVARCDWLREMRTFLTSETVAYEMPAERSVDVDSELDLEWSAFLLSRRGRASKQRY